MVGLPRLTLAIRRWHSEISRASDPGMLSCPARVCWYPAFALPCTWRDPRPCQAGDPKTELWKAGDSCLGTWPRKCLLG